MAHLKLAIDANIFIYAAEAHPEFGRDALELLKAVEHGRVPAAASELCYLEVLAGPAHTAKTLSQAMQLMQLSGTVFLPVSKAVLIAAADLRRRSIGLKTPDAVHIATAIQAGASHFVTNDSDLVKLQLPAIKLLTLKNCKKEVIPT